ncbi:hypothetical protein [Streptomyces sp. NPDC048361]|uniref:hypothetical protein n=1 Tax=Streptomyces sp. NPDC048361 TaxID=3154720 RepID=UPI0034443C7E
MSGGPFIRNFDGKRSDVIGGYQTGVTTDDISYSSQFDADVITAGDFAGSNASDLMVKWIDGEVTIYKDIDQNTKPPTSLDEHPANCGPCRHAEHRVVH